MQPWLQRVLLESNVDQNHAIGSKCTLSRLWIGVFRLNSGERVRGRSDPSRRGGSCAASRPITPNWWWRGCSVPVTRAASTRSHKCTHAVNPASQRRARARLAGAMTRVQMNARWLPTPLPLAGGPPLRGGRDGPRRALAGA